MLVLLQWKLLQGCWLVGKHFGLLSKLFASLEILDSCSLSLPYSCEVGPHQRTACRKRIRAYIRIQLLLDSLDVPLFVFFFGVGRKMHNFHASQC